MRKQCAAARLGLKLLLALSLVCSSASPVLAQVPMTTVTEERFHDLFVTAGYATAFGAAVGTAFLAWTDEPAANLRYVAMGASLGFLGGSLLGSYVIFSPMLSDADTPALEHGSLIANNTIPTSGIVLRPTWNRHTHRITSIEGGLTLLNF